MDLSLLTPRRAALLAGALALVPAVLLVHTALDKSDTWDEPDYVGEASDLWGHGLPGGTPILPKWGFAIAIRLVDPGIAHAPRGPIVVSTASPEPSLEYWFATPAARRPTILFAARCATILVTLLGGLLLWRAATRFGPFAGAVTHALWCFSPTILAHGSLATLDGWVAATMAGVLLAAITYLERPGIPRALVLGAAFALASASKVTIVGAAPVLAGVVLWGAWQSAPAGRPRWRALGLLSFASLVGWFFTLWAVYKFSVGRVERPDGSLIGTFPFEGWWRYLFEKSGNMREGQPTYMLGETVWTGSSWFFALAIAVKTTIGVQALVLLRVIAMGFRRPSWRELRVDLALLAFPLMLFLVLSNAWNQSNIRFLTPAYPAVFLFTGRVAVDAVRAFDRRGVGLVVAFVVLGAIETLSVHPHHLMFFNRWVGGPRNGPQVLIQNEDWGQDRKRLGEFQRAHKIPRLYYHEFGETEAWGLTFDKLPCEPTTGVFAVHTFFLYLKFPPFWGGIEPGCLNWLTVEPPDERIGYSIYVWTVDEARLERLKAKAGDPHPFFRTATDPVWPQFNEDLEPGK